MKKRSLFLVAVSCLLTAAIAVSIVGCSAPGAVASSSKASSEGSGEMPTIKMVTLCGTAPADTALVSEAISKITREKIGVNVELIPVELGNISQRMSLLLTGGDSAIDVYIAGGWSSLGGMVSNGQALEIDSYIEPYAAELEKALTPEVLNAGKVDGKLYGVARYLDFASGLVYNLRKDVADKYGIKNGDSLTLSELTDLFKKIREEYPDNALIGSTASGLMNGPFESRVDNLGDLSLLGVIADMKTGDTVVNYYETALYDETVSYFKQWKEMGLYMADPLNNTESPMDYIASGKSLGNFGGHFSAELNGIYASQNYGVEMACVSIMDKVAQTPGMYYCVAPNTKSPDKAAAFIALMATDADVVNLLCNGIEGVHYKLDNGVAYYMDGKDASTTGWTMGFAWSQLNSPLSYPFEYPANYYDLMVQSNEESAKSKAFGFQFDAAKVANEVAACANVVNQYRISIEAGAVADIDAAVKEFRQALKDAGVDKLVAEKQTQLDAYIASK